jgi:hypothetical protein
VNPLPVYDPAMTQPAPPQASPYDAGNPLLGGAPANIAVSLQPTPVGQLCVLTIRTASTTLTVFLAKADAETWLQTIKSEVDKMTSSGLIIAGPGAIPPTNGHGG